MINGLPKSEVLMDIAKEIQGTQFGDINVTVTTHRGIPVGLVVSTFKHEKFNGDENTEALKRILTVFKEMVDTKQTGELTFTTVFHEGKVKEVIHQLYDKKSYKVESDGPKL